jgi:hypothetical protein
MKEVKMENKETTWLAGIRQNYNLLLFLVITAFPLGLWGLMMAIAFFGGTLFHDPATFGMDLFMVFVFPLIAAPLLSGAALLIARLLTVRGLRYLVVIGLGILIPLGAYLWVALGHFIARRLYTGPSPETRSAPGPVMGGASAVPLFQDKE